jgi:hypothetical protein
MFTKHLGHLENQLFFKPIKFSKNDWLTGTIRAFFYPGKAES